MWLGFIEKAFLAGVLSLICATLPASAVRAQTAVTTDGNRLAERLCAGCHAIGIEQGASPHTMAPRFTDIAWRWPPEMLAESLAEGIVVGHKGGVKMPEFMLEPNEIDALIAHLEALRAAAP